MTCAYFVSDLHLASGDEPNARIFLRFLERLNAEARAGEGVRPTHLFLVGDVFDLWIGGHDYFIKKFSDVVEALRRLVEADVAVHFFEGNHDLHLQPYWEKGVGVKVHPGPEYFELADRIVRVEHGDLMNPEDKGYLFLRDFLRIPPMRFLALNLPASMVALIGERASRASRAHTSGAKSLPHESIRNLIRQHAENAYMQKPFDLIVTGHVHVPDDHSFAASGKVVRSVNLGSWYEPPRVFVLSDERSEFVQLPTS